MAEPWIDPGAPVWATLGSQRKRNALKLLLEIGGVGVEMGNVLEHRQTGVLSRSEHDFLVRHEPR